MAGHTPSIACSVHDTHTKGFYGVNNKQYIYIINMIQVLCRGYQYFHFHMSRTDGPNTGITESV